MTVVLKEEHRLVLPAPPQTLPMSHAERDEPVHVFGCVVRHVRPAFTTLDEHELIRALKDIVFIFQQNDVAVRLDDACELVWLAERAGGFAVNDILRLLSTNIRVE